MKATVCELPDGGAAFENVWSELARHLRANDSRIVLLPDMPFSNWFVGSSTFDRHVWARAVHEHDVWSLRLTELAPALVLGSRPVDFGNERWDGGFIWDAEHGMQSVHAKAFLPDERSNRQGSWLHSAISPDFTPLETHGLRIGFLIGTELWAEDEARRYGAEDVDILAIPRSGGAASADEWLAHVRTAATLARAYALSSNRSGPFGGQGWIVAPDGGVLGATSESQPFLTVELDIESKHQAVHPIPAAPPIDPLDTGVPPYP